MRADSDHFEKVDRGQLWPAARASWGLAANGRGAGALDPMLTAVNFSIRAWQLERTG